MSESGAKGEQINKNWDTNISDCGTDLNREKDTAVALKETSVRCKATRSNHTMRTHHSDSEQL